ncbi:grasp-with-spasm system SPASM domain peptide maturase [Pseudotenacibaculum haliotis]|uniref:Grasp-with-spasm system SPASM domain peptide maturase n=1 Tax=Pseudotenacibaculum haliotis TaxID=1862138 RepID=A0ABW5LX65_9FLAO
MNKIKLFANCIPVKGAKRSVICDLQRNELYIIPNDLYEILILHSNKTIIEIKKLYNNEYDETIDEYFVFLKQNELVFETKTPHLFPNLKLDWHYPFEISNAILDFDINSKYELVSGLDQLNELKCKHVQLRFFDTITYNTILNLLNHLNKKNSIILSIDILLPFSSEFSKEKLSVLLSDYPRINSFYVFNSDSDQFITPIRGNRAYIVYLKNKLSPKNCGIISSKYFSINIKSFTESLNCNSCLNGKISIDTQGNIKNCPSMTHSFGNIKNVSLKESLHKKDFKKYWSLTKDNIEVCKDCEFRYVCTDCRAYIENIENQYSKPLKCGYDPYTNEWENWEENPVKNKAIEYYDMKKL